MFAIRNLSSSSASLALSLYIFLLLCLFSQIPPVSAEIILINCGSTGNSTDDNTRLWSGDESSPLLSSTKTCAPASLASVTTVPFSKARIFPTAFTYSIPVTADRYFVRLYFYPSDYGNHFASDAVFDVTSGRHTLLKDFSTHDYAQAFNLDYIVREYSLNVSLTSSSSGSGWLNLTFTPSSNVSNSYAFVNGIEVVSMPNLFVNTREPTLIGTTVPYSIDADLAIETMYRLNVGGGGISPSQDSGLLDRSWSDDSNYVAGATFGITYSKDKNVVIRYPSNVPKYIAPDDIYGTARSMPWYNDTINLNYNLSWILKVDPGFYYLVRLHFCEIQYTYTLPNQRVFTIYVNNQTAVGDFDVISRSTGIGIPVYFDSVTVVPHGDGQEDIWVSLHPNIQFHPQYTNVILNGLEVFKLSNFFGSLAGPKPTPLHTATVDPTKASNLDSNRNNSHKVGWAAAMIGVFSAVGALLLISLLVYSVYRGWCKAVGCFVHGWLPLAMSNSGKSAKDAFTGSDASSLASKLCRRFAFAEIKEDAEVDELLVVWNSDNDDTTKKDLAEQSSDSKAFSSKNTMVTIEK